MSPVTTHTRRSPPGPQSDICRAMSAETMKIPEPIIEPTTSEIAASGPIPRMNSDGELLSTRGAWVDVAMGSRSGGGGSGRLRGRRGGAGLRGAHRLVDDGLPCRRETAHDLGRAIHYADGSGDRLDRELAGAHGVLDRLGEAGEEPGRALPLGVFTAQEFDIVKRLVAAFVAKGIQRAQNALLERVVHGRPAPDLPPPDTTV